MPSIKVLGSAIKIVNSGVFKTNLNYLRRYWSGLGADNNWSTVNNWRELLSPVPYSSLVFGGITRLNPSNNLASDTPLNGITFDYNAGAFQMSGNRFTLYSSGITNNSDNVQTIDNNIILSASRISVNSRSKNTTLNGVLSGKNVTFVKTGSGTATINVARSMFTGSVAVSAGTLRLENTVANGGFDLASTPITTYNLSGDGANLLCYGNVNSPNRFYINNNTINFGSAGSQTVTVSANVMFINSKFTTNGGPTNYIYSALDGSGYVNAQYANVIYDVADGTDDVDLELNAAIVQQTFIKSGAGKVSTVNGFSNVYLVVSAGTFDISRGGTLTGILGTIVNNGTISYSSSANSNTSTTVISGTGNFIKSGNSSLTLNSNNAYSGSTSIIQGTLYTTKATASAAFTSTTLTVNFSVDPNINDTFRFFPGSTVNSYPTVTLIGTTKSGSYNSSNSTLTIT